ncbi:MAG: NifU family protein [Rickettsiales bacterium]|nr:NifU family protein [Rickettsiales bacterium]
MPLDKLNNLDTEKKIKSVIRTKVRPILLEDGGNIEFISYNEEEGLVNVKLSGSCHACPMASITLRGVVEDTLKLHIPDLGEIKVLNLEECQDSSEEM